MTYETPETDNRKWGPLTPEKHARLTALGVYLHVYHDGVDITRRTFYADDTGDGYADVYLVAPHGGFYLDRASGTIATVRLFHIRMIPGPPLLD